MSEDTITKPTTTDPDGQHDTPVKPTGQHDKPTGQHDGGDGQHDGGEGQHDGSGEN